VFADLAGFTALTEAHGDDQAADLAVEFCRSVQQILPVDGTEVIKTIGDAVMLRVSDPADAVRLGLRIAHEIGARHGFPIVRVGIHTGPAVERDGDWFGAAVNVAARISGRASGGEVLLSGATRERAGDFDDVRIEERGRVELKNVATPLVLCAAYRESVRGPEGLAVDPGRSSRRLRRPAALARRGVRLLLARVRGRLRLGARAIRRAIGGRVNQPAELGASLARLLGD
jgi:class 3 adenylate cyclase